MKNEEKIKKTQQKLEQIKKEFEQKSELLANLIKERAVLRADFEVGGNKRVKKEIDDLTVKVEELELYKKNKPELITALESRIESLKKQNAAEDRQVNIKKQNEIVREIETASASLLSALEDALEKNKNLQNLWSNLNSLTDITKVGISFSKPATTGSQQSLEYLCSIIKGELHGQGRRDRVFRNVFI